MYFVLNPFFYYIANQDSIRDFVTLESNGKHICNMTYSELRNLVERYVIMNSHGVDGNRKDSYIMYICDALVAN